MIGQSSFGVEDSLACVGDQVLVREDALVEVARHSPSTLPTWRFLPATTGGKLIGWRERNDRTVAVVDIDTDDHRLVVFVSDRKIVRALRPDPQSRRRHVHTPRGR